MHEVLSLSSTISAVYSNCFEQMIESTEDVDKLKNSTLEIIAGDLTKIFKENSTLERSVKYKDEDTLKLTLLTMHETIIAKTKVFAKNS